jgi:UDP-N-acetylmuramate: L-alanyl-gamma-D-glutamyl-meso-diaminopimelate ligase
LTNAPQNARRVKKTEITHLPGLKFNGCNSDTILFYDTTVKNLPPPSVNILNKDVHHKKLPALSAQEVLDGFGGGVLVCESTQEVLNFIEDQDWNNKVLLMMSSGNFDGIDYDALGAQLVAKL